MRCRSRSSVPKRRSGESEREAWIAFRRDSLREIEVPGRPNRIGHSIVGIAAPHIRFDREEQIGNHPAIVTINDVGEGDGRSWIAVELVEGRTLREAVAEDPMPIRQAWSIARQLAEGLAAAHSRGILHRDLKPENVMVTPEGGSRSSISGLPAR